MALNVQNISFKYPQGEPILDSVSLCVGDSEMLALVGPSGCGKSTLLHCIAGLIEADSGEVSIDGKAMNAVQVHQRSIGIMMQDQPLYEHLTVEKNIAFPLHARGKNVSPVAQLMEQLDLASIANRKVSKCSGGERRRIALARAVVIRPKVLLLDEPLISIDPLLRETMKEFIQTIHTELKASTIIVSHHHVEVEKMCEQLITMEQL